MEFLKPIPVSAMLTCESCIKKVTPKTGRSGPMLVLELERKFLLEGEPAVIEKQSVIYKQDITAPASGTGNPEDKRETETRVGISELDVFRFSALTFNSHRIHYDAPYTTDMESKPGLLIQAKLTSLHLLKFCMDKAAAAQPVAYSFRSVRPFYCPDELGMGTSIDTSAKIVSAWGCNANGEIVMQAELRY